MGSWTQPAIVQIPLRLLSKKCAEIRANDAKLPLGDLGEPIWGECQVLSSFGGIPNQRWPRSSKMPSNGPNRLWFFKKYTPLKLL